MTSVQSSSEQFNHYQIVDETTVESTFSTFHFSTHYPEQNPQHALRDITSGLSHIGLFDGVEKE